ncbi:extracellular solute-binding protein [Beduinella massiliensis]|uniref:extracellular solute-binding protein n=1 Tax=Beduinella massiliensis TaxID=1852363 RepID=UPI000C824B64
MKKLLALLLALALTLGAAAALAEPEPYTLPLSEETVTFTYWKPTHTNARQLMTDYNGNEIYQELERRTNVHIEWIHPAAGQEAEQFNLLVAANDLPDFICMESGASYPGGAAKAIADGVFLPLEDYVAQYCPNLTAIYEKYPEIAKQMKTNDGHIWGFGELMLEEDSTGPISPWAGPAVRVDWLEELGLDMPVTLDDWHEMLVAFRDQKGAQVPLIMQKSGLPGMHEFISAFGVAKDFYHENNVVKFGPLEAGYKEYLTLMNQWYQEGLLDVDFPSTASDANFYAEYLTTGKAGAICETYQDIVPLYNALLGDQGKIAAVPYPKKNADDQLHIGCLTHDVETGHSTVYVNAKLDPEKLPIAMRWWDYMYSDEAFMLCNWGIEGLTHTIVDGKPQFTDRVLKNEEGLEYALWAWKYKIFNGTFRYTGYAMPPENAQASLDSITTWAKDNDMANMLPPSSIPLEYSAEYNGIMTEVYTYRDQMALKFILGTEPLEKYDEFVETLKTLGIERAIEIQQIALDMYNNR